MPITTIYIIELVGEKRVARLGDQRFDRGQMLAKIKARTLQGIDTEEEWAAYCLLERRIAEDRWAVASTRSKKESES